MGDGLDDWRRVHPGARLDAAMVMSRIALTVSRAGLREAMPGATEDQLKVAFVRLHYGEDLAQGVERRLREGPGAQPSIPE